MIYLLAMFLPFLAVMIVGRLGTGIVLLLLQLTLVGWVPAIIVAWVIIFNAKIDKQHKELIKTLQPREM